jgi:hypothetical protein
MDQEDIRFLMPKPRDLHDFCSTECVAMEIYPDSHLQGLDRDKTISISDLESKMSHQEEEEMFHLSPSESDRKILLRSVESSSSVTDPSLVRQIRIMNAKIEELQQDQLQSKKAATNRELMVERHFKEQARANPVQQRVHPILLLLQSRPGRSPLPPRRSHLQLPSRLCMS